VIPLGADCGAAVPTGFPSIDAILGGGPRRGDLVVLGGEAGCGKSALALAIALRASGARFYSGEMSSPRALERAVAIEARVRIDDLRRDALDEVARAAMASVAERLVEQGPTFGDLPSSGIETLDEQLRRAGKPAALVVIDPIQALAPGMRPLNEEIATIALSLKRVAIAHGTAVLATTHVPTATHDVPDRRPRLQDFGALGALAQHADVVLGLYREEMFDPNRGIEGATELHVLKNRNGPLGYVDLYFYKQWVRFEDVMEPGP
jgi:replicative DNA helicase